MAELATSLRVLSPNRVAEGTASIPKVGGREPGLDLLRALAVLMVVVFHLVVMSPITTPWIRDFAMAGQYGVDLFFVLSGWLIGGLYWRERANFGDVEIGRFWMRRWIRTVPPYFVALALSYGGALIVRGDKFDIGYLLFLQNYYERLPYFLVSWSLCIEEHFYLLMPIAFLIMFRRSSPRAIAWAVFAIVAISPVARYFWFSGAKEDFGFSQTATHLRLDGIAIGVWLSFVAVQSPRLLDNCRPYASYAVGVSAAALALIEFSGARLNYTLWWTAISVLFAALLVWARTSDWSGVRLGAIARGVALPSYSIYLTHPLALHIANTAVNGKNGVTAIILYSSIALPLVVAFAAAFYWVVERSSILIRDAVAPRRAPAPQRL